MSNVILLSGLLGVYLTSVLCFSFVSHPIGYCVLLMISAVSFSGFVYFCVGFSWYLALFCLVYVGGVYILLVYVSMFNSNFFGGLGVGGLSVVFFFLFFFFFSLGLTLIWNCFVECSHFVCSFEDGFGYCFFCVVLLLCFVLVSFVSGSKDSFFR